MSSETKRSFVGGAALLMVSNLVGKVIGALYKIWLAALIGDGMVFYNLPYPVYNFLLVVSSAGLPTAISRLVATRVATQDRAGARAVLRVARRVLLFTGIIASAGMLLLAKPIAAAVKAPDAWPAFMMMAPAIFVVCMISSYRGYFQGIQKMAPTAISQLIEQIGKLAVGFPLAVYGVQYGPVWGAVGAIAGMVVSELGALALMLGAAARQRSIDRDIIHIRAPETGIMRALLAIAIPVTIGSAIAPIVGVVDSALVLNRLLDIGFTTQQAHQGYNALTTIVNSLVGMPAAITLSLSVALVPAVSSALAHKDTGKAASTVKTGIRLAALLGMPAALGMGLLAQPIVDFIFASQSIGLRTTGAELLQVAAVGVFFLAIVQTTTGSLQGLGKPMVPVLTMGAGVLIKVALNYTLIGTPSINVMGASIATVCCYLVAMCGNVFFVMKYAGIKPAFLISLLRTFGATLVMGGALLLMNRYIRGNISDARYVVLAIAAAVAVYGIAALLLRALTREDMLLIPGGAKLIRLGERIMGKLRRK